MFVRAVWRSQRLVDPKQATRESEGPSTRDGSGVCATGFRQMTRGLFDR
jgi:hypothetical protein